jgi:hypothetical protein
MLVMDTRFGLDEKVRTEFACYRNGQIAISLISQDGEPWLDATCSLPSPVAADCVAIKNWSENEGLPSILLHAGVIEGAPVAHVRSGFVAVPIYRLTRAALAEVLP